MSIMLKALEEVISLLIYKFFNESIVFELSLLIVNRFDNCNDSAPNSIFSISITSKF